MCLNKAAYVAPVSVGYKFYYVNQPAPGDQATFSPIYGLTELRYYRGHWYNSEGDRGGWHLRCHDDGAKYYPIGFHLLKDKIDVKRFLYSAPAGWPDDTMYADFASKNKYGDGRSIVLLEVEYTGVLARGIDGTCRAVGDGGTECVVAARMRIANVIPFEDIPKFLKNIRERKAKPQQ